MPVELTFISCLEFNIVLMIVIGYLFGSIPIAYLYCKACGVNIFKFGSGNPGSTNVGRALGKKHGRIVFALDIVKTLLAILVAHGILLYFNKIETCDVYYSFINTKNYFPFRVLQYGGTLRDPFVVWTTGIGVTLGHSFPFTTKFKGGKGITCTVAIVGYFNVAFAILLFLIHKIICKISGYVSLASIFTLIIMFLLSLLMSAINIFPFNFIYKNIVLIEIFIVMLLGIIRHKENIIRLEAGTENRI